MAFMIADLYAEFRAKGLEELQGQVGKLRGVLDTAAASVTTVGDTLSGLGTGAYALGRTMFAMGAAMTTPLIGAAKVFGSMGDALVKMSERTGIAVEALSEFAYAAELSNADLGDFERGVRLMQRQIVAAANNSTEAKAALASVGLVIEDLAALHPEEQFALIAKRIAELPNPARQAAAAMEIFGRGGTMLLPMIKNLDILVAEGRRLGITISTEDAKAADEFKDVLTSLWAVVKTGTFAIGRALSPALKEMAERVREAMTQVREWVRGNELVIVSALKFAVVVTAMGVVLMVVGKLVLAIKALGVATMFLLAHPLVLIFAGVAMIIAAIILAIRRLTNHMADLSDAKARLLEASDRERAGDQESLGVLQALSEKYDLTSTEMDRADQIVDQLTQRYGDLGIYVNRTTGEIEGLGTAMEKVSGAMRLAVELELEAGILEAQRNIKELRKEQETWWAGLKSLVAVGGLGGTAGAVRESSEALDPYLKKLQALQERLRALREGRPEALVGGERPAAPTSAIDIRADTEKKAALEESLNSRIARLRLEGIEDEYLKARSLMTLQYSEELKKIKGNAEAERLLKEALRIDIDNLDNEYNRRAADEQEADYDRRIEEEQRGIRAVADYNHDLSVDIAREKAGQIEDEKERRLALLKIEEGEAVRKAEAARANLGMVKELYRLKAEEITKAPAQESFVKMDRGSWSGLADVWRTIQTGLLKEDPALYLARKQVDLIGQIAGNTEDMSDEAVVAAGGA